MIKSIFSDGTYARKTIGWFKSDRLGFGLYLERDNPDQNKPYILLVIGKFAIRLK